MEEYIILALIIVLLFLYTSYEGYNNISESTEEYCNQSESDTCALLAPNIPDDPKNRFEICGKFNRAVSEKEIAPTEGKFVFPKQELLYDGIWKSHRKIKDNVETQEWEMIKDQYPVEGEYAADKYLHMPKKHMCLDMEVVEKDIYYPDWNVLAMKDRNMYNFDVCDYNKREDHKGSIVYLPAGV